MLARGPRWPSDVSVDGELSHKTSTSYRPSHPGEQAEATGWETMCKTQGTLSSLASKKIFEAMQHEAEKPAEDIVGNIFKGIVERVEDMLKAAFVDIGLGRAAFLHYWDIVPNRFDNSIELVDREVAQRERPRITQKDIPLLYPPGSEVLAQVIKAPTGTKGARITLNVVLRGKCMVLLPESDYSGISRKIEDPQERERLKSILRQLDIPDGMGVVFRSVSQNQSSSDFARDLASLMESWKRIEQAKISEPAPCCLFRT